MSLFRVLPDQPFNAMIMKSISQKIISAIIIFTFSFDTYAQDPIMPVLPDVNNFHEVQEKMNAFFRENPGAKGYKQWKRKEWFLEPRLYPSGQMENLTLKTWKEYSRFVKTLPDERATHGSWVFLGPTSNAIGLGRVNAIAFHPTNANIMYVGTSNGGVWKTSNGGTTWANVSPYIPLLSIADIKLSPSNPNVVYILTGDGDPMPTEDAIHTQTE